MAVTGRLAAGGVSRSVVTVVPGVVDAVGLLFVTGPAQCGDPPLTSLRRRASPRQQRQAAPLDPFADNCVGGTEFAQEAVLAQANRMEAEGRPPGTAGPNTSLARVK
jgi:hypothetical protein